MRSGSGGSNGSSSSSNAWRTAAAAPLSNYEFDFGNLRSGSGSGSGSSSGTNFSFNTGGKSTLNSLKPGAPPSSSPSFVPSWAPQPAASSQQQKQQPPQQKWVHQPAAGLSGASSMVGDISGKSWVPLDTLSKSKNSNSNSNSSSSGVVGGVGSSKADLFGDLLKTPSARNTTNLPSSTVAMNKGISMKDAANAARTATAAAAAAQDDLFGDFMSTSSSSNTFSSPPPPPPAANMFNQRPSPTVDPFPKPAATQQQPKSQDPLEDLWRKIPTQKPVEQQKQVKKNNPTSEDWMNMDDWNTSAEEAANTTELEGLPPPPAGVNGAIAKDKGIEFKQQGQFADAIKWLTWAELLFEGNGAGSDIPSVLSCRASCYKEVGEYRKAVDDCCKVLEIDSSDTEILLQRAFLYESMEKYKLSVKDLREVLQRDPSNRLARNTLSRLVKLVD